MTSLTQHPHCAGNGAPQALSGISCDSRRRTGPAGDAALWGRRPSGMGGKLTDAERARIFARIQQEASTSDLIREFGISRATVGNLRLLMKGQSRTTVSKAAIPIPHWVPDWLREDYTRFGRLYGEERAATECRRMKAEAVRSVIERGAISPREVMSEGAPAKRRPNPVDTARLRGMASPFDDLVTPELIPAGTRLNGHVIKPDERAYRLLDLLNVVIVTTGIPGSDILSPSRKTETVRARQILYWLGKRHGSISVKRLAAFVDRDHSSCVHGIARADRVAASIVDLDTENPVAGCEQLWLATWPSKIAQANRRRPR